MNGTHKGTRSRATIIAEWGVGLGLMLVATSGWVVQRDSGPSEEGDAGPDLIQAGRRLPVDGMAGMGRRTVAVFTSTACAVGLEDADFYRKLVAISAGGEASGFDVLVVTDDPPDTMRTWLENEGVYVEHIVGSPWIEELWAIGVYRTPTVALSDESGIVTDTMMGVLDAKTEERFLAMVGDGRSGEMKGPEDPVVMSEGDNGVEQLWEDGARLVDVRDRAAYRHGHDRRAVNIPQDELHVRGPVELAGVQRVVVDCRVGVLSECRDAARVLAFTDIDAEVAVLVR